MTNETWWAYTHTHTITSLCLSPALRVMQCGEEPLCLLVSEPLAHTQLFDTRPNDTGQRAKRRQESDYIGLVDAFNACEKRSHLEQTEWINEYNKGDKDAKDRMIFNYLRRIYVHIYHDTIQSHMSNDTNPSINWRQYKITTSPSSLGSLMCSRATIRNEQRIERGKFTLHKSEIYSAPETQKVLPHL